MVFLTYNCSYSMNGHMPKMWSKLYECLDAKWEFLEIPEYLLFLC